MRGEAAAACRTCIAFCRPELRYAVLATATLTLNHALLVMSMRRLKMLTAVLFWCQVFYICVRPHLVHIHTPQGHLGRAGEAQGRVGHTVHL